MTSTPLQMRRRRVHLIRRRVVGGATAMFLASTGAIVVQLASGHDPALASTQTTKTQTSRASTSVAAAALPKSSTSSGSSATGSTSSGSSSADSSASSGSASAVTTRAS